VAAILPLSNLTSMVGNPPLCRHCTHSLSQFVDGEPRLMCLWHRRLAVEPCGEWVREPGSDDDLITNTEDQPDEL
jgi:hypothetical protein